MGDPIHLFLRTAGANHLTPDLRSLGRGDLNDVSQWFAPPIFQKLILLEKASSTNSDANPVQVVESGVTNISVSLVQTRFLVCF